MKGFFEERNKLKYPINFISYPVFIFIEAFFWFAKTNLLRKMIVKLFKVRARPEKILKFLNSIDSESNNNLINIFEKNLHVKDVMSIEIPKYSYLSATGKFSVVSHLSLVEVELLATELEKKKEYKVNIFFMTHQFFIKEMLEKFRSKYPKVKLINQERTILDNTTVQYISLFLLLKELTSTFLRS